MIKALRSFLSFFLISNVFIAIGASALCHEVFFLSKGYLEWDWAYGLFVFFATLALYNAHRFISYRRSRLIGRSDRYMIVQELNIWVPVLVLIAALSALLYGWEYFQKFSLEMLLATLLSLVYIAPVFLGKRLRDIGWLKLPVLALVFTLVTAWIPSQIFELPSNIMYWLSAQRFLFVLALTIPFELRDQKTDQHAQVKTIAHFLGEKQAKRLSVLLLLIAMLIGTQLMDLGLYDLSTLLASIFTMVLTGWLVVRSRVQENVFYYLGALDGMLLLHGLSIALVHIQLV